MKSFCLSSLILILILMSCAKTNRFFDLEVIDCENQTASSIVDTIGSEKYITNATIYSKTISGYLFIKHLDKNQIRTAFTSVVGVKLFEFILTPSTDSIIYCIPQFQKDQIIHFIAHDIKLIVFQSPTTTRCLKSDDSNVKIKESISDLERYRYFYNSDYSQISKIYRINKKNKLKSKYVFVYQNGLIRQIDIQHFNISLNIQLAAYQ